VALIGVDAAELNYIRAHLADLPNFRRALDDGRMVELRSQFEALPGSVWLSFFTGQNAGDHGFYLIQGWDAAAMRLRRVTPHWWPLEPFWRDLARQGLR
jgi:predicted AlkP superfamily phosphohydrolase/phosphomutase